MSKPRGPYANTAARRQQIIAVATEHFAQHGFHGASLRSIAADAGISHAAVLRHFPSKEELLAHVVEEHQRAEEQYLTELSRHAPVAQVLVESLVHERAQPGLARLWVTLTAEASSPDHPAAAFVASRYAEWTRLTTRALRQLQKAGELRADLDLKNTARTLLALAHGLQTQALIDPRLDPGAVFAKHLNDCVMAEGRRVVRTRRPSV